MIRNSLPETASRERVTNDNRIPCLDVQNAIRVLSLHLFEFYISQRREKGK
jgi:hypothetical protein